MSYRSEVLDVVRRKGPIAWTDVLAAMAPEPGTSWAVDAAANALRDLVRQGEVRAELGEGQPFGPLLYSVREVPR